MAQTPLGALAQLLKAEVVLSASQLAAFNVGGPFPIVPAPGAGKIVVPFGFALSYASGQFPYIPGADSLVIQDGSTTPLTLAAIVGLLSVPGQSTWTYAPAQNLGGSGWTPTSNVAGLLIAAANNYGGGAIATSAINAPGSGYALGDTGTITNGANDATYIITGVGALGIVTGYSIVDPGTACTVAANNATVDGGAQPGIGIGFTIDINTLHPGDGTLKVITYYQIIDVP